MREIDRERERYRERKRERDVKGGLDVSRKEAWSFCRKQSGVRLCWELEEPKGPKGQTERASERERERERETHTETERGRGRQKERG